MSNKSLAKSKFVTGWVKFVVGWKDFWKRAHADKLEPVFVFMALVIAVLAIKGV